MASGSMAALSVYAWNRRRATGGMPFFWLMLGIALWSLCSVMDLLSTDALATLLWHRSRYFSIVFIPVLWLQFTLAYTGRSRWLTQRRLLLLCIIPVISLVVIWTDDLHQWFYNGYMLLEGKPVVVAVADYGAWFYIHALYSYLLMLAGAIVVILSIFQFPHMFRKQAVGLLVGTLSPLIANGLTTSGIFDTYYLDLTLLGFTVSGLVFTWVLFRFRLLDIVPVARSELVEIMRDAMFVLDQQARVVYINPTAQTLFNLSPEEIFGKNVQESLPGWKELEGHLSGILAKSESRYQSEIDHTPMNGKQSYFDLLVSPLIDDNHKNQGLLIVLHDITKRKEAEKQLEVLNQDLERRIQGRTQELMLAYDTTLEGWARALELRDSDTAGHTERVTDMMVLLASAMGIREEALADVRRGAVLHDIGKMGVPDSILLKAGPLDEDEWNIMRQHPENAVRLLEPIEYLRPALDIPLYHHERWNGMGYPMGLKGQAIPRVARIFAVVDVWDALSSDRPYRKAWDQDKVLEYIAAQAGEQFDPEVVEVFLKIARRPEIIRFY